MVATCGLLSFLEDFEPGAAAISALGQPSNTIPFADAFAPMHAYALDAGRIHVDLADALVQELSRNFSQALSARFARTRDYRGFIRDLWAGGWMDLFAEYPVLARLVEQTVALKMDEARELATGLERDLPMIRAHFGGNFDRVVSIRSGMSDPHRGLRSVKILQFSGGRRLVYKPKDLALDSAWAGLLDWLRARFPLAPVAPRVLNRCTHGWVEFIPHRPVDDAAGIERYYRRAGALLAVLYAVRGTDCHFENLIAYGEHPVLVDTETLIQPGFVVNGSAIAASVTQAGLLPCREEMNGEAVMCGGFDNAAQSSTATRPAWHNVNTDRMAFGERSRIEFNSTNVPTLNGRPVNAGAYLEDILAGFRETCRVLTEYRAELLSAQGPLEPFRGAAARIVLRNTRVYSVLLRCATLPQFLRDERDYSARIQALLAKVGATSLGPPEEIGKAEASALAALDVPMFTTRTDSTSLFTDSGREIPNVIAVSGYDAVVNQIRALDEDDIERQISAIRESFRSATVTLNFVDEARRIGDFLLDCPAIGDLDHSLWSGRSGIALFLAALYRVTGEARYRQASLDLLAETRRAIHAGEQMNGIGGGTGIGSVIYALSRAGESLQDESVTADARLAAELVDPESIRADREFDVMFGAAGCLLGLLAAGRIDAAAVCAGHLLAHQQTQPEGGAAWKGRAPKPATGFAHGAAGIAYALLRLHRVQPDPRLAEAARLAIEYERAHYSAPDRNWLDVRSLADPDRPRYGNSWCHGAPGVGLARLGCLGQLGDTAIAHEIEAALEWMERATPPHSDDLCCGKLAWIELMLEASAKWDRRDLHERACRRAAGMINAKSDLPHPGLFTGVAGMGYTLLRLAEPSRLPCVLLWE